MHFFVCFPTHKSQTSKIFICVNINIIIVFLVGCCHFDFMYFDANNWYSIFFLRCNLFNINWYIIWTKNISLPWSRYALWGGREQRGWHHSQEERKQTFKYHIELISQQSRAETFHVKVDIVTWIVLRREASMTSFSSRLAYKRPWTKSAEISF